MADIHVVVTNASTVLLDDDVAAAVPDLQTQVSRDFAPAWGVDADVTFVPGHGKLPAGAWWLVVLDDADQAGALGYHDLTSEGLPMGKVFAGTDRKYQLQWTVTASHELLEMLADPYINLTAFAQRTDTAGRLYAYEVCDACEADALGYTVGGSLLSDFVLPAWFEPGRGRKGARYDHQGHLHAPFQLAPGGYIGIFDVATGSGWQQLNADRDAHAYASRPPVGSRRERRRTPFDQWVRSEPRSAARAA